MYDLIFYVTLIICVIVRFLQYRAEKESHEATNAGEASDNSFRYFQLNYLLVYLLAVASDWLQGPYVYALYTEYGYTKKDIGILFIAGFGSSAVFGTFIGSIADKYGRRNGVLVFAITYILSCITKHFPQFSILMAGRILGGIATSLLFSSFESWLVYEHNKRGYQPGWLSETFSKAQFGNAVVAIISGQIAGIFAGAFGKVAPFDCSAAVLVVLAVIVMWTWTENYGDERQSVAGGFQKAFAMLMSDEKIIMAGAIQSCFEGAMYTFVFIWTPALQTLQSAADNTEIPHGKIFSTFMVAIMIGSSLFTFLIRLQPVELVMRNMYLVGTSIFVFGVLASGVTELYVGMIIFEVICGIYFPAMGTIRAKYIPEETRSAIMNYLRIPLNAIVVLLLYKDLEVKLIFKICASLLAVATIAQQRLFSISKARIGKNAVVDQDEEGAVDAAA